MRKAPIYLYFNSARIKLTAAHKAEEYPHPMLQCVFFICLQDIYLGEEITIVISKSLVGFLKSCWLIALWVTEQSGIAE